MSKFSLFTLFLSATVVIIVADLLINNYIQYRPLKGQVSASVLRVNSAAQDPTIDEQSQIASDAEIAIHNLIDFSVISKAGFQSVYLQKVPFNGIMFESLDLRDFKSVPVTVNNILQENKNKIATIYEFDSQSRMLGKEIYSLLREKSGKLVAARVNPTNEFGEGSFYINYSEHPDRAFLVVNGGENVYALTYLKELHPLIKNVLAHVIKPNNLSIN